MKKNHVNKNLRIYTGEAPKYPNAADSNYFRERALNILTAIVSGAGFTTAMFFLATLA